MTDEAVPFEQAVRDLMRYSGWPRADVLADPKSATWACYSHLHACVRAIEVGER